MTVFIVLWAIAFNILAWNLDFYRLPKLSSKQFPNIKEKDLGLCFFTYLCIALFLTPLFTKIFLIYLNRFDPSFVSLPITLLTAFQFMSMVSIFILLQAIIYKNNQKTYFQLWKDRQHKEIHSIGLDFGVGALTWMIAFPVVVVLNGLLDKLLQSILNYSSYEQTAVKFVKIASETPIALILALLSVIVMAPLIEEFLFRGVLQTYLKKRVGLKSALLLSSFLFALFHFSLSQGIGNISLIFSLFILGLFLGLLFEKQHSLWAPIGLHMTFNIISAIRILSGTEA